MANQNCCTLKDLGVSCSTIIEQTRKISFVPLYDSSGNRNEFANVAAVTNAAINLKIEEADPSKRFYTTANMDDVTDLRDTPVVQTTATGVDNFVHEAPRKFTANIYESASPAYAGQLKSFACSERMGAFIFDQNGNFVYLKGPNGEVRPIPIEARTYHAQFMTKSSDTVAHVALQWSWNLSTADENWRVIKNVSGGAYSIDLDDLYALNDLSAVISNESTTTFTMALTTDPYGDAVPGMLITDFTLFNDTQSAAIVITTVTETPALSGIYDFVMPVQVSLDIITPTLTKEKFDGASLNAYKIIIP